MSRRDIVIELARNQDGSDPGPERDREWFSEDEVVIHLTDFSPSFPDGWDFDRMEAAYRRPWLEPDLLWSSRDGLMFRVRRESDADLRDRTNAISAAISEAVRAGSLTGDLVFEQVRERVPGVKPMEVLEVALRMGELGLISLDLRREPKGEA